MNDQQQGAFQKQEPVLGVIIPVFNTTRFFSVLLQKLQHIQKTIHPWKMEILIVDDGSNPPVQPILFPGLLIHQLRHSRNLGKGRALKTGFHFFSGRPEVEAIITMDADLQHPPEYIPAMVRALRSSGADVVLGYRKRIPGVMPFHRILSNLLTSLIISLLVGRLIRDSQCGFRLYRKQVLYQLPMERNGFHLESELALRLGWRKVSMAFVEIPTVYQGQPSAIRNVADTLDFIFLIAKLSFQRWFGHV
ncbi:MAG: glycosyltransferase family 2 protein [Calditrichaeota bacterium]|nr:glycosyltransferase family 2 protein [Calditrichota bacterium]